MESTRVIYKNLIIDIKPKDLNDALDALGDMMPKEKEEFMKSVNRALDSAMETIAAKQPLSTKQMQDAANDVGLWFANEVIEGRSEQYKVAVS